ncbi:hypothetical protein GE061_014105 [Apolygus lucorum]|uniref:Uncharacterized protein n=1 Tax=Apolygus lucorum TaxID=248454 RepID=A0A8S9XPK6_APOLU|nr:hypothetical protein GE061_014105 [Apolygus lucorum]
MALSRTLLSSGQYWRNGILSQPPQIPKCREFYKSSLMCCRGSGGGGGRSLRPPNTVPDTLASRVESTMHRNANRNFNDSGMTTISGNFAYQSNFRTRKRWKNPDQS